MTINHKTIKLLYVVIISIFVAIPFVYAGDDPSIKGELRNKIQASMDNFIKRNTINGIYAHFDPVTGKLLNLKLDYLHSGIVKKGDIFVSCADMINQANGKKVDMDFFVRDNFGELVTVQGIVHKIDGKKRKYQLENIKTKK